MIRVIQLPMLWIVNVEISSMLGRFWTSISELILVDPSFDDASFAILSTIMFWLLGSAQTLPYQTLASDALST